MTPRAESAARRILSLLMVLILLFAQTDSAPFAALTGFAQEVAVEAETPAPEETKAPEEQATEAPTQAPTEDPTQAPTEAPAEDPTLEPTENPTEAPTQAPSENPTQAPTENPTLAPTEQPTLDPVVTATPAVTVPPRRLMARDAEVPVFSDALTAAQWAAANDFVIIPLATVASGQPVKTGEPFVYKVYYTTSTAPLYDPGDNIPKSAYSSYENVTVQVVAPANIKLIDNSGNLIANPGETATIHLNGGSKINAGSAGSFTFQGVMIDNGLSASGTVYDPLQLSIHAAVPISDQTVNFGYTLPVGSSNNDTDVTNSADNEWTIDKTAGSAEPSISGSGDAAVATFTYYIEAGKKVGGSLSGSSGDYNMYGALNFISGGFSLTDTLPTFVKDGVTIAPQSSSISLLDGSGNALSTVNGGAGDASLTISDYRTTQLDAAYASVGAAPLANQTPFYSKYKVTVSYLLIDLTLPYGSSLENDANTFTLTNAAALGYHLAGTSASSASDSASIVWKKTTPPGKLSILKIIPFNGSDQPYDAFWSTVFPGGAEFGVYKAADWDDGANAPKSGATPAATYSLTVNDQSHTLSLEPGSYYVLETTVPGGTNKGAAVPATIVSGETQTVQYRNTANYGLLTFNKLGAGNAPLSGATFALKKDGNVVTTATSNIDGSVYISAPAGTYQLVETYAPNGYVKMDPMDVTIASGSTVALADIVDELSTASLSISKYAVTYDISSGSYAAADMTNVKNLSGVSTSSFSFALSWTEADGGVSTGHSQTIQLGTGGTASVTGLKRVDADGNWISYTLTENVPSDSAFAADDASFTWSFDRSHPTSYSASFYDVLKGQLKIKKQQNDLDAAAAYPSGKGFKLYRKDGSDYVLAASLTTGSDGTATSGALAIDGSDGSAIQYYLVEDHDAAYSVAYPSSASITVDSVSVAAWPVTLGFQKLTDLTGTPVVNNQNKGKIRIVKTNSDGSVMLQGGKFKVYTLSGEVKTYLNGGSDYVTDASGAIVVSPVDLGVAYYVEEVAAPANYLLSGTATQNCTLSTPFEVKQLTFANDRKPLLTVTKTLKNLATLVTSAGSNISFSVYQLTGGNTFAAVSPAVSFTTDASGAASVYLPDAGSYYLRETYPAGVILPGMESGLYTSLTLGDDGSYYYGPIAASRNATASASINNYLNRGKIEVTKKSAKTPFSLLSGAVFSISVTPPAGDTTTITALTALGFTFSSGKYTKNNMSATNASGFTSFEGLPIYASDNTPLVYTVSETTAPTNYLLAAQPQTATFLTASDRVFEMNFADTPKVTLGANKVSEDKYASKGHTVQLALSGATFDVYLKTVSGSDVTLAYVANTTSNSSGVLSFSNLDGLSTYVIFERTPPAGYDLPDGKSAIASAGALNGTYTAAAYSALLTTYYNTGEYNFASTTNTSYTFPAKLVNYLPYAQFKLNKFDSVNTTMPLDHAKYQLYSTTVAAGNLTYAQLMSQGTLESYTYETGTESGASGTFITNPQTYGKVYWLVEIAAPAGYDLPALQADRVVGPLTPPGTGWGTNYTKNGLTTVSAYNTAQSGGGTGTTRYLQIEINKILKDSTGTTNLGNLPGATFELWLANATGDPVKKITTMTTGLDMGSAANPASVAGRAISESFDMAALYADATYGQYVTRTGSVDAYDYSAQFVLKETAYPKDVTPSKIYWVLTASTAGTAYTVNTYYTGGNSIPNLQTQKVAVRVRKLGYSVASPATQYPLQGVVIGIYSTADALVTSATTDQYGYVSFQLNPSTSYYAKEITAIAGYEKPATNKFSFTTGTYGTTLADIPITNPQYRKLTIAKKDAAGNAVPNVVFQLNPWSGTTLGSGIKDANGNAISNTVTTGSDGTGVIMVPAGIYRVDEMSIGGVSLTATEKAYFLLANPGANQFAMNDSGTAGFTLNVTNPATGALNVTKTDDALAPLSGVSFAVQFKAFATLTESAPSYTDSGFSATGDWLSFAGSATWTTNASGLIQKTGLLPGWYKLTETVPGGYVSTGVTPFVVKVSAKGLGQADNTAASLNVVNTRKGYVTLTKTFLEPVVSLPSTVTFKIYKDQALTVAADPATVTVNISGRTSSATFAVDPGTYYIVEDSGSWYGRYSVNGGQEHWLDASFPVTVVSANTVANVVRADVSNNLKTATVSLKKVDDGTTPGPVAGAVFAIYYLDGLNNKVYLGTPVATGADGTLTLTVTLPKARVLLDQTAYFLEEQSAPAQYKLAAPVSLTLTPGASLSWAQESSLTIVDETALVIDLTKYGKTKAHVSGDPLGPVLSGATFELYKVDTSAGTGVLVASATTDAGGALRFGNLPKLTDAYKYSLRESSTPFTHVTGSLQLYKGETLLASESVSVGGSPLSLYPVAQDENSVALKGYNTPKGSVAVLKYNYIDPKNAVAVPLNANFEIKNAQGAVVGTVKSSEHLAWHPNSLDGGSVTYTSGSYYTGSNGSYYSAAILKNLEPGQYTVTETGAATGFLLPSGAGASDPWRTVATVTVGDDGDAAVVYFANVPNLSINPVVQKSVYAVNGTALNGAAAQINASLQKGEQSLTFELSNIASTPSNLFMLPIEQLILKDDTLVFKGLNQSSQNVNAQVTHFVTQVTVGKASYLPTPVSTPPTGEAAKVTAKVYGIAGGAQTLVSTVNISGAAQTVAFPANTYDGFQIAYTASGSGAMLQPGFALDPVMVEMRFAQTDDAAVVPARQITNTVNAKLTYRLGTDQYDSGWKDSTAAAVVVPDEALPKASLNKTAVKLEIVDGARVPVVNGSTDVTVQPGDWLRYTVTLTNASDLPITNPVLVDKLPAMLAVDLADVGFSTTSSGLTAQDAGSYTDGSGIVYVYRNLTGTLAAHQTASLTIEGMVRINSVVTNLSSIENIAYAASTDRIKKNVLNPYGTPFTDVNGVLPANLLDGGALGGTTGQVYQALAASKTVALMQTSELRIYKLASADASGIGNFVSNDEYAIASVKDGSAGKGQIKYRIVIVNGGTSSATQVRMVDRLPVIGDTGMNGSGRLSKWPVTFGGSVTAVDETGASVYFKTYSTSSSLSATSLWTAAKSGPTGWTSGADSSAKAILLDFSKTSGGANYSLKPGGKIIITYTAWAPSIDVGEAALNSYFFEASVNDAGAATDGVSTVSSGPAKVVLMPETVSAGNRVWIDKNMNGVQDGADLDNAALLTGEPSYTGGGITVSLLKFFNSDSNASIAATTGLDVSGFYQFGALTPATIKSGVSTSDAYDANGNIVNSKLKGSGRASYQIKVTGIPDGYFVPSPFAQNGGVAPNYATGSGRSEDSNFSKSGEAYLSEKFYLPPGQNNPTFDLGLCRVRDLEIEKRGSDNAALAGVQFTVYGPFTGSEIAAGVTVGDGNKVATLTTDTAGKASLVSTSSLHLNYYYSYVVVETGPAEHFDSTLLTVSGGSPAASSLYTVHGDAINGLNYFVLPAKSGQEARKDAVDVINQYVAGGSTSISGNKSLLGRDLEAGEFSFQLTDVTDPAHPASVATANDAAGAFSFDLNYGLNDIGVHTYEVAEVPGGVANHTYDGRVFTVTVTVADSTLRDGVLSITKEITYTDVTQPNEPASTIWFLNNYEAETSVTLDGTKSLTGRAIADGDFSFKLTDVSGETPSDVETVTNDGGSFKFSELDYDQSDIGSTYTYEVSELNGGVANHTYDGSLYTVTVGVGYDALTGQLTTEVKTYKDGSETPEATNVLAFSNDYADTTSVTLDGTKTLTGRAIADGDFSFKLTDVTDSANPVDVNTVQNIGGAFQFPALGYDQGDIGSTYTYEVTELNGGVANHTYDDTLYTVTVGVGYDALTGQLTTEVKTYKDGSETPEATNVLAFSNDYAATTSVTLDGTKTLTGRTIADGDFSFKLTDVTDGANPVDVNTVSNMGGSFQFPALGYDQSDIGSTYTYEVSELNGGVANHTYDGSLYTVTVGVGYDALTGQLTTEVKTYKDGSETPEATNVLAFSNDYAAETSVTLDGTKTLTGRAIADGDFSFKLTDVTDSANPVDVNTVQNIGGAFQFPALGYDQGDIGSTYTYEVTELNGGVANHTYDDTLYTVTVGVGYDALTGQLTTEVKTYKDGSETPEATNVLAFSNDYAATTSVTLDGTKTLTGRAIADGDFSFKLTDVMDSANPVDVNTVQNIGGAFQFPTLDYDQDDIGSTYTYEVSELNGGVANHTYDDTLYTVTVGVGYDALTGQLTTEVKTYKDGSETPEATNVLAFSNEYKAETSVALDGTKTLTGRAITDGDFSFKLTDVSGETPADVETVTNDGENFKFSELDYDQDDIGSTYTYEVSELNGGVANHTYDDTLYTVTVGVGYDALTGQLTTEVKTYKDGSETPEATNVLAFSNDYAATTSVTLDGTKTLTGRTIADGDFSFKLTDVTDGVNPVDVNTVPNVGGSFEFPALGYDQGDIGAMYTYQVAEINRGVGGFTYDQTVYTVTVAVGYDAATGQLTTGVKSYKGDSQTPEATNVLAFANDYQATGAYTPVGNKALEGRALLDGMFRFEARDELGALVSTGVSNASGQIAFSTIQYQKNATRDDTGTHHYTITEIAGNDQGIDDTGIVYSRESFPLTVVVDDAAGNGQLGIQASYPNGSALFQNNTEKVDVKGKKIWVDQSNLYAKRPDNVTVYLLADSVAVDSATLSGAENEWSYSFTNLPRYKYGDQYNVSEVVYTVDESQVTGYYKTIGVQTISTDESGRRVLGYDMTNSIRLFPISKRTAGGARLSGATLALYKVRSGVRTLIETWRTSTDSDHVASGLEPGNYILVETAVPFGYVRAADIAITVADDGAITSSALTGGVVRMVDELIPTADVTGTKTWVDLGNQSGLRPTDIQITLYADGVPVAAQPTWTQNGDIWTYTYAGLNVYRAGNSGARIAYTVQETPVPGYETLYDALNITNQLANIEVKYVEIVGKKTWVDDGNADGARPDGITVYLLRNGEVIERKVVTESDEWAYSFSNLPTSDGHSTVYTYTINEKMVPGYARSVSGYNLTNTYVPPEEPPVEPKKPIYTPETWEELVTLLDAEVPLYGGLLKTGEETPLYPYVFGGLGLFALVLLLLSDRRRRKGKGKK